jgi:hypothetical protein
MREVVRVIYPRTATESRLRIFQRKFPPRKKARMTHNPLFYAGWAAFWQGLFCGYPGGFAR